MTYFDHAATSFPKPPEVRKAVLRAMEECGNPGRGGHRQAMLAAETVYECRLQCAAMFDCEPRQIVFTSGTTQGLNMAIKDLVSRGDAVVVSGFEHNAVMRPLHAIGAKVTVAGRKLFDPRDTLREFEQAIGADTKAVVCTHVSNVFGYILPLQNIANLCRKRGVPLIVDAAQSAGMLPLSLRRLAADYVALPGHKGLLGPMGTGVLLCGREPQRTLLEGGTGSLSRELAMPDFLPDRLEAGTPNVPGIAGLSAGIRLIENIGIRAITDREIMISDHILNKLEDSGRFRCFSGPLRSGVLSVQPTEESCEAAAERLAEKGFAVRAGLHCAPLAHASAGTLEKGTLRISASFLHTAEDAERLTDAMIM